MRGNNLNPWLENKFDGKVFGLFPSHILFFQYSFISTIWFADI